jgi:transcriptional regulator GlxA family with amidase domain
LRLTAPLKSIGRRPAQGHPSGGAGYTSTGLSERTLTRRFTASTGLTPLRYQQELRIERAEHLIGQGTTVESAARAVGFQDARMLRRLRARTALATRE